MTKRGSRVKSRVRAAVAGSALGAVVLLSGCGSALGTDAAATVDGRVITKTEAADVARQINTAFQPQQPLTLGDAVTLLIRAPYINELAQRSGKAVTATMARSALKEHLDEPATDATVEVLQADAAAQTLTEADKIELSQKFQKLKVSVNSRYGTYDPARAVLDPAMPNWVVPHVAQ
jgi:hypothetical protein